MFLKDESEESPFFSSRDSTNKDCDLLIFTYHLKYIILFGFLIILLGNKRRLKDAYL